MNKILMISLLLLNITRMNAQEYNSVANDKAIVVQNNARFTILTERLIRLEYQENKLFTDNASLTFVNRNLPVPEFSVRQDADTNWLVISTRYVSVYYKKNSGSFSDKNLKITYSDDKDTLTWHPGLKDKRNLKGTTRTLDGASGKFSFFKMSRVKLDDGILSRNGWSVIDDSGRPLFDHSDWPWVEGNNSTGQDLYFLGYGKNYKAALYDYTLIAGKIPIPPKFAFGIWYSKWENYTGQELKDIVNNYEKNDLPLDVLVVDMDWHITKKSAPDLFKKYPQKLNGWTGFTWEKKYFPDYKGFLGWTNEHHIQTCLNIHPAEGVQPYEEAYPAFAKAMDIDTTNHPTIKFDITNKKFAENYFKILLHPYEKDGVDFWWLDWQQWNKTAIKGVNPTFYLNYLHYTDMQHEGKRPLIFHRWGGLGNHRYEIGFSGDVVINWRSLRYQPGFTSTAANVGFSYWSHDIGGHWGFMQPKKKKDPELFTRWVQWGAFSPVFRTHGTQDADVERKMWKYPAPYFETMKKAVQLRYSLVPYIYTNARIAYDSGVSLIRPMYYENPESELAYHLPLQYYFGDDMIVAPVTYKTGLNTSKREVWLPAGNWYNFYTNNIIKGNKKISESFRFDEIPVYVKAGSIIPSQTPKLNMSQSVLDTLILTVYPDEKNNADFTLYEDDGSSEAYRKNIFSKTRFKLEENQIQWYLSIIPDGNNFDGKQDKRVYIIKIVNAAEPINVTDLIHNKSINFTFDERVKTLMFTTVSESISLRNYKIEFKIK